jgi:hypothetical protein
MFPGGHWPPLQDGSKVCNFTGFQLQLELVCNKRDEFGIGRFSLGSLRNIDLLADLSLCKVRIFS